MEIKDFNMRLHRTGGEHTVYEVSDVDETTAVRYYGYINAEGYWIIQKYDTSVPASKSMRYASGQTGYIAAWTGRAALTYGYYNELH